VSLSTKLTHGAVGDVAVLSTRRIENLVAYCGPYEFEDVVAEATGSDLIEVDDRAALEFSRRVYKWTAFGTRSKRIAKFVAPNPSVIRLTRDYEIFLPIFCSPYHVHALAAVPGWRKHCRRAACVITEVWSDQLPEYLIEQLSEFDHIFVCTQNAVERLSALSGVPVTYVPFAVDVLRFAPSSPSGERPIDMCNIGRRSSVTHEALLEVSKSREFFYYYDTVSAGEDRKQRTFRVDSAREHRMLLASLLQRSRYFIANRGRVNEPRFLAGRDEISARFYEGAAAGTVMLGEAPCIDEFAHQFDWPDAVISLPFDSAGVGEFLRELDADPSRLARIRLDNVLNAAARHDWVYRLGTIIETIGAKPSRRGEERLGKLESLAGRLRALR
jgi:hypothetical protein